MEIEDILKDVGLTLTETKIYLNLLRMGPSTGYGVSKESKIHKANVYESIKNLINKNMVSFFKEGKITKYQANDPSSIVNLIKLKENQINSIMPQLKVMERMATERSEASVLKGVRTFMNILYKFLEYNEPILVFGIPKIAPEILKDYITSFHKERIKRKIRMDHIYNYDAIERIKYLRKLSLTGAKALPETISSNASTNICGNEVVISIWKQNDVKMIKIVDKEIAESYKSYFRYLWKLAK